MRDRRIDILTEGVRQDVCYRDATQLRKGEVKRSYRFLDCFMCSSFYSLKNTALIRKEKD